MYAKNYARPSLLVVAIVEGEHRNVDPNEASRNSHLPIPCNSILVGKETILQSNSQILPLFVLTFGKNNKATSVPFEEVPLFNFAKVLIKHLPLAQMLKENFPKSSLGTLLHLSSQAANEKDPSAWALDYLNSFDLDDM